MDRATSLSVLVELIYDAALDGSLWPLVLERLAELVRAPSAVLLFHDFTSPRGHIDASYNVAPEAARSYAEYYGALDPWVAAAKARDLLRPGVPLLGQQLISTQELRRTEYYADLAKPFGLSRVLSAAVRHDSRAMSGVSVLRPDAQSEFGAEERAMLEQLLPHFTRALRVHTRLAAVEGARDDLVQALDRVPTPVLMVRGNASIVFTNAAADRLLRRRDGLVARQKLVLTLDVGETSRLHALIRAAAVSGLSTPQGEDLAVTRSLPKRPLTLLIAPVRASSFCAEVCPDAMVVIFVNDPEREVPATPDMLAVLWGLTPTEAKIAVGVARGETLRDLARRLGIAATTVRWHVKQILAKSGTRTQPDLVRAVLLSVAASPTIRPGE
jgi:DNA-binding CsgD family transcriptional regulator